VALLLGAGAMGAMLGAAAYAVQSGPTPGLVFQIYFNHHCGLHFLIALCFKSTNLLSTWDILF